MLTVYLIIIIYSRKITAPISKLTAYTAQMKQAQDREAKLYIVSQVKRDDTFAEIAAEYEAAKYVEKHGDIHARAASIKSQVTRTATGMFSGEIDPHD